MNYKAIKNMEDILILKEVVPSDYGDKIVAQHLDELYPDELIVIFNEVSKLLEEMEFALPWK